MPSISSFSQVNSLNRSSSWSISTVQYLGRQRLQIMITKMFTLCCKNPWYMIFLSHSNYVARRPEQQHSLQTSTLLCAKPPRYMSKIHHRHNFSFFSANLTYIPSSVTFSHLYYHNLTKRILLFLKLKHFSGVSIQLTGEIQIMMKDINIHSSILQ